MRYGYVDWTALGALALVSSALLLTRLDSPYLWQDEAQTAVIAKTVLSGGVPLGSDGRNFFSQEQGIEYADGYVWKWHTWLPFYLVAASFSALGATTFAARLPVALFGIATVLLCYATGRALWGDRRAALAGASMLALSVPYLLLVRQCRWYGIAAFFALLALFAYLRIGRSERRFSLLLFASASLLFHTHYLYAAGLLASLILHALFFERARLPRAIGISAAVTGANSPWIVWFASTRYGERYAERLGDLGHHAAVGLHLGGDLLGYFVNPLLLGIPLAIVALRWRQGESGLAGLLQVEPATRRNVALLAIYCATNVLLLSLLAPGAYVRYLTPVAPAMFLLVGVMLGALAARSVVAASVVFVLWLATGQLRDFVYELRHDFDGPIEGIVRFLDDNAQPGDTLAISSGDMPLKFYTQLRVIGGLTGEDLSQAAGADWIIVRRHAFSDIDRAVKAELAAHVVPGDYEAYRIRYPDTAFENREDLRFHRFRTAPASHPRVVIHRKRSGSPHPGSRGAPDSQQSVTEPSGPGAG